MRSGGIIFASLIRAMAGIILSGVLASAASAEPSSAREAVDAAVSSLNLQTEIPPAPANGGQAGNNQRADGRAEKEDYPYDWEGHQPDGYGDSIQVPAMVARLLLWVSVAVIIVIIAMAVRDNMRNIGRARQLEREEPLEIKAGDAQAVARMILSRDEADELARRGQFAAAMHALLLRSISEMRRRMDMSIAASLTSREILNRVGLPPEGRSSLADIIGRVEISYFGPHQPGADEYLACRRSFELLTGTLGRGAAR